MTQQQYFAVFCDEGLYSILRASSNQDACDICASRAYDRSHDLGTLVARPATESEVEEKEAE